MVPSVGQAAETTLEYPGWSLAMMTMLILIASLPIPLGYGHSLLSGRAGPGDEGERARYVKCDPPELHLPRGDDGADRLGASFLPPALDGRYRLLPQQEEEEGGEEEDDTGV